MHWKSIGKYVGVRLLRNNTNLNAIMDVRNPGSPTFPSCKRYIDVVSSYVVDGQSITITIYGSDPSTYPYRHEIVKNILASCPAEKVAEKYEVSDQEYYDVTFGPRLH